jgi:hypothetical protein
LFFECPSLIETQRNRLTIENFNIFYLFAGSPLDINVIGGEPKEISVLIHQLKVVQINQNCSFSIETKDNGEGDVKVVITSNLFIIFC